MLASMSIWLVSPSFRVGLVKSWVSVVTPLRVWKVTL
jgi:hypothetical protein